MFTPPVGRVNETRHHQTAVLRLGPRWDAGAPPRPHAASAGALTVDRERAAAAVLAQLVLHQNAVLPAVLECAGGDDDRAYAAGGVVPELGVGRDVDVALVEGHRGPRVPKEGTGHGAVLAAQHRVWLERDQEAGCVAPVLLLVWLQLGAQVIDCAGGTWWAVSVPGTLANARLLRAPKGRLTGDRDPKAWPTFPSVLNSGAPTLAGARGSIQPPSHSLVILGLHYQNSVHGILRFSRPSNPNFFPVASSRMELLTGC